MLSLQHPLEGPWALLASLGDTLDSHRSLGAATHSEFRERRPWKASGAISAIWLLLRSLQGEQKRGWLNSSEATKPCPILSTFQAHGRAGASLKLEKQGASSPIHLKNLRLLSPCAVQGHTQVGHASLGLFLAKLSPAPQLSLIPFLMSTMAPIGAQAEMEHNSQLWSYARLGLSI